MAEVIGRPFQKGNKMGRGGAKVGTGPKPDQVLKIRDQIYEHLHKGSPAALHAFTQLCGLMDSDDGDLRLRACVAVMNRVVGMPHISATIEKGGSTKVVELLQQMLLARAPGHDMRQEPPLLAHHPKAIVTGRGNTEGARIKKVKSEPSG